MSVTKFPVPVVLANLGVLLFANSVLAVVNPAAFVSDGLLVGALFGVGVITLTVTFLKANQKEVTKTVILSIDQSFEKE